MLAGAALFLPPVAERGPAPDGAAQLAALARLRVARSRVHGPRRRAPGGERGAPRRALRRFREGPGRGASPDAALARLHANASELASEAALRPRQLARPGARQPREPARWSSASRCCRRRPRAHPGVPREGRVRRQGPRRVHVRRQRRPQRHGERGEPRRLGKRDLGRDEGGALRRPAAMFAFLFLLWRNLWDSVLAFFPLALASLVCVAGDGAGGHALQLRQRDRAADVDRHGHRQRRAPGAPPPHRPRGGRRARDEHRARGLLLGAHDGAVLRQPRLRLAPRHGRDRSDAHARRRRHPRLLRGRAARGARLRRRCAGAGARAPAARRLGVAVPRPWRRLLRIRSCGADGDERRGRDLLRTGRRTGCTASPCSEP